MDSAIPILAAGLLAWGELREWERYPPLEMCRQNYGTLSLYACECEEAAATIGGFAAEHWRDRAAEARSFMPAWWELWWIASDVGRRTKLEHEDMLRRVVGDENFARGYWPPVLPWWHFERSR